VSGLLLSTPAIVLRAVAYGEADRVVTLLGRTTGRVSAVARAARKSQRRFGGGLGLGASGEAVLRERSGDADLMWLERFDVAEGRLGLGSDLGRMAHAGYAAELCERLCAPRQPEPALYDWLARFLELIEQRGASAERLRAFELGLLSRLGLCPSFEACVACRRTDVEAEVVRLQPLRGGIMCRACAPRSGTPLSPAVRGALARFAGIDLDAADQPPLAREVNGACRNAVFELVGQHLTSPLKSLSFVEKLGGL
jgi:DNA repair protein RecO (recombination protein O)